MNYLLVIIGGLLSLIVPILHLRKILHEEEKQYLKFLKQNQKRAYDITVIGALLLSFVLTFALAILAMNGVKMMIQDITESLLNLALFIIPFLIIATIGIVTFYVPFKHTVPEAYVYNHQLANIVLLMMGVVSFFITGVLGYFLFLGLEQLIGLSDGKKGFVEILESPSFHTVKLFFYSIFIAPALMLLGAILGLWSRRRKRYN